MTALSVRFEPLPGNRGAYALGHMYLAGDGVASSEIGGSRRAMMVYLSAALFLQQVRGFVTSPRRALRYVATDSSFSVGASLTGKRVRVTADGVVVATTSVQEFVRACLAGAKDLLSRHPLPVGDPALEDLAESITALEELPQSPAPEVRRTDRGPRRGR